jgi:hypothetical protein
MAKPKRAPWRPHGNPTNSSTRSRTERFADLAPERFQDQQPDDSRPRRARGIGAVLSGLRLGSAVVEGQQSEVMHHLMAETVEAAIEKIHTIQKSARENKDPTDPGGP